MRLQDGVEHVYGNIFQNIEFICYHNVDHWYRIGFEKIYRRDYLSIKGCSKCYCLYYSYCFVYRDSQCLYQHTLVRWDDSDSICYLYSLLPIEKKIKTTNGFW